MRTKDLHEDSHSLKLTLALGLAAGTIITYGQTAYAENNVTETPVTEVVAQPSDPVTPVPVETTSEVLPTEIPATSEVTVDVPTEPALPTETTEEAPVDPTVPTETPGETTEATELPTDTTAVSPSEQSNITEPSTTTENENQVTTPVVPTNNNTVQVTPLQPEVNPTPTVEERFEPIVTDKGYTVIGNEKGIVTVANADGTTTTGEAEAFGGVTNQNGTVSFTTKEGKKETLPETGVAENIALTLLGFLLLLFGFIISGKKSTSTSRSYIYL